MNSEIILYQTENGDTKIEVVLDNETVWLSQKQMVLLFQITKQNISLHINNIFKERELIQNSVVKEYLTAESFCNSPSLKILLMCKLIFCLVVLNKTIICA